MTSALFIGVGIVAAVVGAYRLIRAVRRRRPRGLAVAALALGCALIVLADSMQILESLIYPSLGRLLSNVFTITAAYGLLLTVLELTRNSTGLLPRRRGRFGLYVAAVAILVATFFATPDLPTGLGLFGDLYASHPTLLVYITAYSVYLAVAVVDIFVVAVRAFAATRGLFRAGMAVLLAACVLAFFYLAGKIVSIFASLAGVNGEPVCSGPFSSISCALSIAFPALSVLLLVIALVIMTLGARLAVSLAGRRAVRDLRPLHEAVRARVPQVARDRLARTATDRLVRMVVEIRDGLLLLGLHDGAAPEVVAALRGNETGHVDSDQRPAPQELPDLRSEDLWLEVDRLRPVARQLTDSDQGR